MAWLFFIDESGHDHKTTPYEVRGGFAIHVSQLWSFVQDMQRLEVESFGCQLHEYKKELKGSTLIDRKRFKFARQSEPFRGSDRQQLCRSFSIPMESFTFPIRTNLERPHKKGGNAPPATPTHYWREAAYEAEPPSMNVD